MNFATENLEIYKIRVDYRDLINPIIAVFRIVVWPERVLVFVYVSLAVYSVEAVCIV